MKTVEKITRDGDIQTFEIITSRKELTEWLHCALWESVYSSYAKDEGNIHTDADTSTFYYDKEGNFFSITEGDKVKRPNVSNIAKLLQHNGCTTVIYGDAPIVFNEHYGDWEVNFD